MTAVGSRMRNVTTIRMAEEGGEEVGELTSSVYVRVRADRGSE